jgi:PhoU domain
MALGGKHSLPGFEQSLEELRADILLMASVVRRSLSNAKTGFVQRDEDDCSAVIADDEEVDLLVKQVDRGGINILIRFQPLASDFRAVLATIKLGSHLKNISDHAVNIARRARALIQESALEEDNELSTYSSWWMRPLQKPWRLSLRLITCEPRSCAARWSRLLKAPAIYWKNSVTLWVRIRSVPGFT